MRGGFGGAKTPEQRSSVVTSGVIKHPKAQEGEKGGMPMKVKNNTDAPRLRKINWKNVSLVGLHLLVLVLLALSQEFVTTEVVASALPQVLL